MSITLFFYKITRKIENIKTRYYIMKALITIFYYSGGLLALIGFFYLMKVLFKILDVNLNFSNDFSVSFVPTIVIAFLVLILRFWKERFRRSPYVVPSFMKWKDNIYKYQVLVIKNHSPNLARHIHIKLVDCPDFPNKEEIERKIFSLAPQQSKYIKLEEVNSKEILHPEMYNKVFKIRILYLGGTTVYYKELEMEYPCFEEEYH